MPPLSFLAHVVSSSDIHPSQAAAFDRLKAGRFEFWDKERMQRDCVNLHTEPVQFRPVAFRIDPITISENIRRSYPPERRQYLRVRSGNRLNRLPQGKWMWISSARR